MKITPVKGTNDYLPNEAALRDMIQSRIVEVYKNNGFMRIMTPAIEDIENLDKSEGGDNLNLIFKIMKRGEKLEKAIAAGDEKGLADLGLRYDLTLPLCRYYAANKEKLPTPANCIQTDKVYRAERPQKGRLREFVQCDIDILGSESTDCEIELIYVTAKALKAVYLNDFK
ncbi:MAG: ATP phosphoribosyltransferase regulatory subunit, partial [Lachnospiraceae bacterium]|nr:ATP phosphoribosyltransferase regulatory subunit [Lachnospiraceae bacterium]